MLNHKFPNTTIGWHYDVENHCLDLMALEDIARGDEMFLCYGDTSKSYFINYGFIQDITGGNRVRIKVALDQNDPLLEAKLKVLPADIQEKGFKICWFVGDLENDMAKDFLGYIRMVVLEKKDENVL